MSHTAKCCGKNVCGGHKEKVSFEKGLSQIPSNGVPHYKEVMLKSWSKGIYGKPFERLDGFQQHQVIAGIKDDIKENKKQMKEWKK